MPALISSVQRFDCNSGIPKDVWDLLHADAAAANLILPHAEKVFGLQEFIPRIISTAQLWLIYSKPGTSAIQFILSCTEGPLGKYPLFIVPTIPVAQLTPQLLKNSMEAFCNALLNQPDFSSRRVFSIFSLDLVAEAFAGAWKKLAGIDPIQEPYYNAIFMTCSSDTLVLCNPSSDDLVIELRPAVEQDAEKIAVLCQEFAATSPPFVLSREKADDEAKFMIANKQVWVHEIQTPSGETDIASIVAVTRKSKAVATITKVYTPDKWRGKRCAERLVRRVCKDLLKTYEQVVLYVGVKNPANKVYGRVGFRGFVDGSPAIAGVNHWLEIGFNPDEVELGHW